MLQTMHSTTHHQQHGIVMLHTSNPPPPGSCSSASTSSAASIASSTSAGSEGSGPTLHHLHLQQAHLGHLNPQQMHHHPMHQTHSRRPSTSSSVRTALTDGPSTDRHPMNRAQLPQFNHNRMYSQTQAEAAKSGGGLRSRTKTIRLTRPCISGHSRRVASLQLGGLPGASGSGQVAGALAASFGFAVRGGREFGIGFFVSRVDRGSEADVRGLRVGDQLLRVNGYAVDDAVHRELSQYVSCQDRITLKVRGVGMLPVKDRQSDALSWHPVPGQIAPAIAAAQQRRPAPTDSEYLCQDVRITLDVEPRTKLGLGICKGPEWKPGIFVQFTKDESVARDAGLRPGDQLLSCNGVDFADVLFSEAVAVMKASQHLEMVVRTAAGVDLFPGESSGYNSSASSVTGGDQSPCWGDPGSKRLSMVREEDAGVEKLGHNKIWDRSDHDRRADRRLHSVQPPVVPDSFRSASAQPTNPTQSAADGPNNEANSKSNTNTTIIKLSETGTIINNTMVPLIADKSAASHRGRSNEMPSDTNVRRQLPTMRENSNSTSQGSYHPDNVDASNRNNNHHRLAANNQQANGGSGSQMADIRFVSRKIETKTVTVEVHRGTDEVSPAPQAARPPPPPPPPMPPLRAAETPEAEVQSLQSLQSLQSQQSIGSRSDASVSLTSAISEELKKRAERPRTTPLQVGGNNCGVSPPIAGRVALKKVRSTFGATGANSEDKHNALIDEFKLAHQKMFRNAAASSKDSEASAQERQLELRGSTASYPDSPSPDYDDTSQNSTIIRQPQQQQKQQPARLAANGNGSNGGNGGTMGRCAAHEMAKATGDAAELESIDSYKLTNPASPPPKPPASYFQSAATGPATLKKPARPVAVTIGEYGGARKDQPRQFDFIAGGASSVVDGAERRSSGEDAAEVSHRLKTELESTLSRSNLRSRTEGGMVNNQCDNTNGFRNNGQTLLRTVSLAPPNGGQLFGNGGTTTGSGSGRPTLHKTQSNVEKITAMLVSQNLMGSRQPMSTATTAAAASSLNSSTSISCPAAPSNNGSTRVTINVAGNETGDTIGNGIPQAPISGILKNGNGASGSASSSSSAATSTTSLEQRNITFGNITTVLTDNL